MKLFAIFFSLFALCFSLQATRYNLKDFISEALEKSPQLSEQQAQVEFAKAQESLARAKSWTSAKLESQISPVPAAEGDSMKSRTEWGEWGPMFTNTLEIWQPLYTFGSLSAARKAGKAGVRAEEQLLARDQWKLRYEIAELYYGYQLAYELSDLTGDFVNKLEKALDHFAKIKKNAPSKITYAIAELKAQNLEALKAKEQSRLAMAWKLGKLDNAYDLQWDQSNLSIREMPEEKMKDWKKNFSDSRPEWKALNEESEAKSALADVEDGQAWPQIYLFAKGQYNESSHRKNTSSGPFSYDPSNTKVAVGGVGLRWNFGFWELKAQRAKARAEAKKVVAKKNYLQQGMLLEAQKNLLDWKQKKDSIEWRAKASQDASRAWKEAQISFGMKNITGEKLFEAMGEYGSQQKKYLETIYQLNLSSFKFEQSVGQEF